MSTSIPFRGFKDSSNGLILRSDDEIDSQLNELRLQKQQIQQQTPPPRRPTTHQQHPQQQQQSHQQISPFGHGDDRSTHPSVAASHTTALNNPRNSLHTPASKKSPFAKITSPRESMATQTNGHQQYSVAPHSNSVIHPSSPKPTAPATGHQQLTQSTPLPIRIDTSTPTAMAASILNQPSQPTSPTPNLEEVRRHNQLKRSQVNTQLANASQRIQIEHRKLEFISTELNRIDSTLQANIAKLRGEIDTVSNELHTTQRDFDLKERAYNQAKELRDKTNQRKLMLVKHLDYLILSNEQNKAKKLQEIELLLSTPTTNEDMSVVLSRLEKAAAERERLSKQQQPVFTGFEESLPQNSQ